MSGGNYELHSPTPLLRMFDVAKAKAFYLDYLGFRVDWEHRFEPGMPLYMQISSGSCKLHLSEHHGDCTPGSAVRIEVTNIRGYYELLASRDYAYARPGLENAFGGGEICVVDPFGNRIVFYEQAEENG